MGPTVEHLRARERDPLKAVVLCAGLGSRLFPLTPNRPKHLLPLANRSLIRRSLELCLDLGVDRIAVVLHPSMAWTEPLLATEADGLPVSVLYQMEPKGLADAVRCARSFVADEPFLLLLGDAVLSTHAVATIRTEIHKPGTRLFVQEVTDPQRFGIVTVDADHQVIALQEKPGESVSNLAIVGLYRIEPEIFNAISRIGPSVRGELEITDAIEWLLEQDRPVHAHTLDGAWFDAGTLDSVLSANAHLISEHPEEGPLKVLVDPAAVVRNSRIGPNVSVGVGARLEDVEIANAIILPEASISRIRADRVIVGEGAQIHGSGSEEIEGRIVADGEILVPS